MSSTDQVRNFRSTRRLIVAVLLAIGCSGGLDPSGCGGGCGDEGGGCAPIPGGFKGTKTNNSVTMKISKSGFDFFGDNLEALVEQFMGQGLTFDIPCTAASSDPDLLICDLNGDKKCDSADANHSSRNSGTCRANGEIRSVDLAAVEHPNGGAVVEVKVRLYLKTGKIPVRAEAWVIGQTCEVDFDAGRGPRDTLPFDLDLRLTVDPVWGNILAVEPGEVDLLGAIDSQDISIKGGFPCNLLDVNFIKDLVLDFAKGPVEELITEMVDSIRCRQCGEPGPEQCPSAGPLIATCDEESNLCYTDKEKGLCPPAVLGLETRVDVASLLGDFGVSPGSLLDIYAVVGGQDPNGRAAVKADSGGLVMGIMGGSDAPAVNLDPGADGVPLCVPRVYWSPRGDPSVIDYDAEAAAGGFPDYKVGIGISDTFLDKTFNDAYHAGALCLEVGGETVDLLSSGLFSTFLPSLNVLTSGDDVPLMIAVRPKSPPNVVIGAGSTKEDADGKMVPDDPLLTLNLESLNLDFYAMIEERYARLFTLSTDVKLPLSLEFDPVANSMLPVLGSLDALLGNVQATNNKMLAEDPQQLAELVGSLVGMIQPLLGDALSPIELPAFEGIKLVIPEGGVRGVNKFSGQPGYEHLAIFADLEFEQGLAFTATTAVDAALVDAQIPSRDELFGPERKESRAVIQAKAGGSMWVGHPGFEYSWRVNGGLWSPWTRNDRFEVASPVLRLQGRHVIEVRSRAIDLAGTVSRQPARIGFTVDYDPPKVELVYDEDADRVLTLATDRLADNSQLSYAYRVAGGNWSGFGPISEFRLSQLGEEPSLEVKVRDPSGNEAQAVFGLSASQIAFRDKAAARKAEAAQFDMAEGGCSQVGSSFLALLGLGALLARRRRSR